MGCDSVQSSTWQATHFPFEDVGASAGSCKGKLIACCVPSFPKRPKTPGLLKSTRALDMEQCVLNASVQFTITFSGGETSSPARVLTRKRWPSAATSYELPKKSLAAWSWKSCVAVPGSKDWPGWTGTAISVWLGAT